MEMERKFKKKMFYSSSSGTWWFPAAITMANSLAFQGLKCRINNFTSELHDT